jgi:hypothetical protein
MVTGNIYLLTYLLTYKYRDVPNLLRREKVAVVVVFQAGCAIANFFLTRRKTKNFSRSNSCCLFHFKSSHPEELF